MSLNPVLAAGRYGRLMDSSAASNRSFIAELALSHLTFRKFGLVFKRLLTPKLQMMFASHSGRLTTCSGLITLLVSFVGEHPTSYVSLAIASDAIPRWGRLLRRRSSMAKSFALAELTILRVPS